MSLLPIFPILCFAVTISALGIFMLRRAEARAAWERIVREREIYVARGCPLVEPLSADQEYDRLVIPTYRPMPDPFLMDHETDTHTLHDFPDLAHRNEVAAAIYSRQGRLDRIGHSAASSPDRARAQEWPDLEEAGVER